MSDFKAHTSYYVNVNAIRRACTEKQAFRDSWEAINELYQCLISLFEYVYPTEDFTFYDLIRSEGLYDLIMEHYSDIVNYDTLSAPMLGFKNPFGVIMNTRDPVDVPGALELSHQFNLLTSIDTTKKIEYIKKSDTQWKHNLSMNEIAEILQSTEKTVRLKINNIPYWAESIQRDEKHTRKYKIMIGRIESLR